MKQCPACGTQYTDDSLQYCLQDGTALPGPFVAAGEIETVISARNRFEAPSTQKLDTSGLGAVPAGKRPRTALIIVTTALVTLLVLLIAGAGVWIYFSPSRGDTVRKSNVDRNSAVNLTPTPSPTPRLSPTPAISPTVSKAELEMFRQEVSDAVLGWKEDTESLDLDSLMDRYAGRAEYYNTSGAPRDAIRRDKSRALEAFDTVRMEISDLSVDIDEKGENATAEFDKGWEFEGDRNSRGRVRSQLKFRKVGGRWLIVSEKDLKVY